MKILMLGCKDWPYGHSINYEMNVGGGTDKYIHNLCSKLSEKGVGIELVARRFPGQLKEERESNITIHRVWFIPGYFTRLPSFAFFSVLKGIMLRGQFDIIHGHGLFGAVSAVVLAKILGIPCVITRHGFTIQETVKKSRRMIGMQIVLERAVTNKADKIIFLSRDEHTKVISKMKLDSDKIALIESATVIPPDLSINRVKDGEKTTVLYVGRLVNDKGLEELVRSFPLLPEHLQKRTRYVILGDGYLNTRLQEIITENDLSGSVQMTGFTKTPEEWYAKADIFVLASLHEGFPIALLEAMSYGLPCIINDFGVPIPDDAVMIMPNNKPHTIAEYITRLAENPDLREMLGMRARQLVINRFSFDRVTDEYLRLYNKLLEDKK